MSNSQRPNRAHRRAQRDQGPHRSLQRGRIGDREQPAPVSNGGHTEREWSVTCVFDPDGTGHDFGYTVGLAQLAHPELHLWARPTHGSDPGADFKLSPSDICLMLNDYAERLLSGDLHPGDGLSRWLDAGLTEVSITVGEAVHPLEVEALGVTPGAKVLPLHWELIREPEGQPAPVTRRVGASIELLTMRWRGLVADLGGSVRPGPPDTDHTQTYGPWSPAIEAARDAVGIVGAMGELSWCLDALADRFAEIGHLVAVAAALARRLGRTPAFEAALEAAVADGEAAMTRADSLWVDMTDEEVDYLLPHARHHMGLVLRACYGHMVVFEELAELDGIDTDLVCSIQGTVMSVVRCVAHPGHTWSDDQGPGDGWVDESWVDESWVDEDRPDEGWTDVG